MYLNKVFLFGNLTRDPELRSLPSGNAVVNFGMATNRLWKDREGRRQEGVEYHNIVAFGRQAEVVAQYLRKGGGVLVEGRLQTRSWDGEGGVKRQRTEIIAERIQFAPRWNSSGGGQQGGDPDGKTERTSGGQQTQGKKEEELETIQYPEEENKADDIPF